MTSAHHNEEWKPVPLAGFEHLYEVSNLGRVRKTTTNKYGPYKAGYVLVGKIDQSGRHVVGLRNGSGKKKTVHISRMVLIAFSGVEPEGMFCCHNDGNPSNNRFENLRWDTPKGNSADMGKHGTLRTGQTHWTAKNPSRPWAGDAHWTKRNPELMPHGDAHWARKKPEKLSRGINNGNAKLTETQVAEMRREYEAGATQVVLANKYGINQTVVSDIVRRVSWRHVP